MKRLFSLFFVLFFVEMVMGQNLVPNPGFEDYTNCPNDVGELYCATGWKNCSNQTTGSPDYFNICANATTPYVGVPNTLLGFQQPHSGNGYAGIICYETGATNWREIIGTKFLTPMTIGQKYYVSFFVNLSLNYSGLNTNTSIDKLGIRFTTVNHDSAHGPSINNICNIVSSSFVTDTSGWTKISGSFIADSSYQYLLIGNFFDDLNTNKIRYGGTPDSNSYYFVDDMCISTDSLYSYQWTGIDDISHLIITSIYPNPFINNINIDNSNAGQIINVNIYDEMGGIVYSKHFESALPIYTLNQLDFLKSGVYFIQINYKNRNSIVKKLIKLKT